MSLASYHIDDAAIERIKCNQSSRITKLAVRHRAVAFSDPESSTIKVGVKGIEP
jgi:hypothetical protein